jgi:WD40 repeat protein/Ca2+-binding EF-hand superfamily protein
MAKLKNMYDKNPSSTQPDKKQLMSILTIGKRETDIIFDYFDMDGNGQLDSYEFTCCMAMLVHSSIEMKAEFLFKLYDVDSNNFLTRDELVFLVRNYFLANKKQFSSAEIEKKTDEFLKNADLDLDKKLSLREFQTYLTKNREILGTLDSYSVLLSNNPISTGPMGTSTTKPGNRVNKIEPEHHDDHDEDDDGNFNNNQFAEDDNFNEADQMDPDLYAELMREKEDKSEEKQKFKEGAEFVTKVNEGLFKEEVEMEATEFSACKPWMGVVLHSVPSNYQPARGEDAQPDAHLELEYVHGYRCHDTRNNLRYAENGDIVYHSAAVGIVMNKEERTQKFFFDHIDDITSLAIHPNKRLVATGEIGPYPLIAIWDTETMECKVRMNGPLQKGINHLAFSKDGRYLIATAADDDHNVAIYDWEKGSAVQNTNIKARQKAQQATPTLAWGKGTRANILGACFNQGGDTIALVCVKEVNFCTYAGGKLTVKKGTGLRGNDMTTIMCGAYIGNTLVAGSFNGSLALFNGSSFTKSVKAHASAINCIYARDNNTGFLTGGNDGMIFIWDSKFTISQKLSILGTAINSLNPKVRSICEDGNGNYLVGTRGGEIVEFQGESPVVISRGHFDMELWGLAVHPSREKYYTVGQDKMLALWDIATRDIEKFVTIPQPGEVMTISSDGKYIAIGCKNGEMYVYDGNTLQQKTIKKDRKDPISEIKFSPNNKYLAIGCVDFLIFIYDVSKNFTLVKKLKGHVSRVTHMDWSEDSETIQSNSTSYDLLYHNVQGGVQVPGGASAYKDEKWYSWTCVIGWPVQGIWPPCASGDDINAVDRDKSCSVLATADDFGKVKLFKYPCPIEKSGFNKYVGHSSHVTCVRFTTSNKYLISTGGNDKSIFQWKFKKDDEAEQEAEALQQIDDQENDPDDKIGQNFKVEEMEMTEFGASKPFLGEVKASTPKGYVPPKGAGDAPNQSIKIKYVHGYRAFDTRMNVKYTYDDRVVYHAAALGIVLDKNTNTQSYFQGHHEDMVALAIHPNGKIVATGQMAEAGKAKLIDIFVWDVDTKQVLANLVGFHLRAIRLLAFSPDGKHLLSGGQDDDNSVAIYDWANSKLIATSPVDKSRVLDGLFLNDTEFVTCGLKHIKFWSFTGRNLTSSKGIFGSLPAESLLTMAVAFQNKTLHAGDAKGNLIIWAGRNATKSIKAHNGALWCLYHKNGLLYSGGQDGLIKVYTNTYQIKETIDFSKLTAFNPGIRSIDMNTQNNLLVGTKGGDIIELVNKKPKVLIQSHADNELWALTVHPNNPNLVASGGGDMTLRIWDIRTNKQIKHVILDQDFRAIDWSSDGKYLAVGSMEGKIYYISVDTMQVKATYQSIFKTEKQWIQELKISPDSKYIAYGAHGGVSKVEVLTVTNTPKVFQQYAIINPRFTSALTHLDWSSDSNFIVCNSLAFELKFLNLSAKNLVSSSAAVDIDWYTWTCLFGFPVQGIWPPACTGYVVNYTCKSHSGKILATADDFSLVKLFKYPCVIEKAKYREFRGHSSHVCKLRFSVNDLYLISTGGNDKCVIIWETDWGTPTEDGGDNMEEEQNNYNEEEGGDENNNYGDEDNYQDDQGDQYGGEYQDEPEPEPEPEPVKKPVNNKNTTANNNVNNNVKPQPKQEELAKKPVQQTAKEPTKKTVAPKKQMVIEEDEYMGDQAGVPGGDNGPSWKAACIEPDNASRLSDDLRRRPKVKLELEHVFGYRTKDTRNNLKYISNNTITYHAGKVLIIQDIQTGKQALMTHHQDEILSFAIDSKKQLIATGENNKGDTVQPCIHLWTNTGELVSRLDENFKKGINCIDFSPSSQILGAVTLDDEHTIYVFNIDSKKLIAKVSGGNTKILDICFKNDKEFVTVGIKHYKYWNINNGNLVAKEGNFGETDNKVGLVTLNDENFITGSAAGEVTLWKEDKLILSKKVHLKNVDTIVAKNDL